MIKKMRKLSKKALYLLVIVSSLIAPNLAHAHKAISRAIE